MKHKMALPGIVAKKLNMYALILRRKGKRENTLKKEQKHKIAGAEISVVHRLYSI